MAAPLFGKRWYAKSKEEHEEAVTNFKAAVFASKSGTDEGIRQNMVHFLKVIPKIQKTYLEMRLFDQKDMPSFEQFNEWRESMKQIAQAEHDRLFILMTAQAKGWGFAKKLEFYQSGDAADENYAKVAKEMVKREEKREDDKDRRTKRSQNGRPRYHPYGQSYNRWAPTPFGYQQPVAALGAPPPPPPPLPATPNHYGPRMGRAHLRCHNCGELGHFARECPKAPSAPNMEKMENVSDNFRAGSIHDAGVWDYWTDTLQCSPWVTDILKFGYKIPFVTLPGKYEESNNATVLKEAKVVEDILLELQATGVIEFVDEKPHCVNPLGLITKTTDQGPKHRLVLDASRWLNLHIQPPMVKLAHLDKALLMTERDEYQVVFDLKSAYHHVKIAKEHVSFLGAKAIIKGKQQYLVFKHLPFGLNSAVHAMTKIWKPLTAHFHKKGIKFSIYIDDGRILAKTHEQAEEHRLFVMECLRKSGWQVSLEKSDGPGMASQVKLYLGFIINTHQMTVQYPREKLEEFCKFVNAALENSQVEVKVLAKIMGKLISLLPSHGTCARICSRSGYVLIDEHVARHGWQGMITWTVDARRELFFFTQVGQNFNGQSIVNALTDIRVDTKLTNPQTSQQGSGATNLDSVIVSDASQLKAAVKWLQGAPTNWTCIFNFTVEESKLSSGERELLAVHKLLQDPEKRNDLRETNVMWATDSTNLVAFLKKGSSKKRIQNLVFDVLKWSAEVHCVITPIHLFREDERIREVDFLSKCPDSDNWSIDMLSFNKLNEKFQFTVDLFADDKNNRVQTFVSKYYHPKALAVNAFAVEWTGMLWICPPTSLLVRIIRRIKTSACRGILVLPNWPASDFYCEIFRENEIMSPFKLVEEFHPFIYQNEGAKSTPLKGITQFSFMALYFDSL